MTNKTKGLIYGVIATVSYGMNPLFTLPSHTAGMSVNTVLFCRYLFMAVVLGILMKMQYQSFALHKADASSLVIMGLLFPFSSLLLLMSYGYTDTGVASIILFVYPMMIAAIMGIFFKEEISTTIAFPILSTLSSVTLLYRGDGNKPSPTLGTIFALPSLPSYVIYTVGVDRLIPKNLPTTKLTFYAALFGLPVYIVHLSSCTELQIIPSVWFWADVLILVTLLAVILPIYTVFAIHCIGLTPTAISGALEPITTPFFSVLLFHEKLTPQSMVGILTIITAVALITTSKSFIRKMGMLLQMDKK